MAWLIDFQSNFTAEFRNPSCKHIQHSQIWKYISITTSKQLSCVWHTIRNIKLASNPLTIYKQAMNGYTVTAPIAAKSFYVTKTLGSFENFKDELCMNFSFSTYNEILYNPCLDYQWKLDVYSKWPYKSHAGHHTVSFAWSKINTPNGLTLHSVTEGIQMHLLNLTNKK